jgi:hypothetical protein
MDEPTALGNVFLLCCRLMTILLQGEVGCSSLPGNGAVCAVVPIARGAAHGLSATVHDPALSAFLTPERRERDTREPREPLRGVAVLFDRILASNSAGDRHAHSLNDQRASVKAHRIPQCHHPAFQSCESRS